VVGLVVTDKSAGQVIKRLKNFDLTPDAVARRCVLEKDTNAILGPSILPVVVAQPDRRLQTIVLCWSGMTDTKHMVHTQEEEHTSKPLLLYLASLSRPGPFGPFLSTKEC